MSLSKLVDPTGEATHYITKADVPERPNDSRWVLFEQGVWYWFSADDSISKPTTPMVRRARSGKGSWYRFGTQSYPVDKVTEITAPIAPPQPESKARPHAELIKAWADGADIEYWAQENCEWLPTANPGWGGTLKYRIKPEPVSPPMSKIPRAVFEKAKSRSHRKYTLRLAKLRQQQAALNLQVSALQLAYEAKNSRQAVFAKEHVA